MEFDETLEENGNEDYVVLEQSYFNRGILMGVLNNGGNIPIGNFGFAFHKKENNVVLMEVRYFPKGNYSKLKYVGKKKKVNDFSSNVTEEVEL